VNPLPPKWPGIVMILAGLLGLVFMVNPKAAGVALIVVILAACLLCALGALSALIAAERADRAMGVTSEEVERSAREYADVLRERLRMEEAEVSAAAVILDDFPARGSATEHKPMGGDQGLSQDTATPGANFQPAATSATTARDRKGAPHRSLPE